MKTVLSILILFIVTGCATTTGNTPREPGYRAAVSAMVAPGYPVNRIQKPQAFGLVNSFKGSDTQGYSYSPSAPNSRGELTEAGATWISGEDQTAVASVYHAGLTPQPGHTAKWLNWEESTGTDIVDGTRFQYRMLKGRYEDAVWDANNIPNDAPACAVAVQLMAHSVTRDKRTVLAYTEGRTCDKLNLHGIGAEQRLRGAAYDHFGLR